MRGLVIVAAFVLGINAAFTQQLGYMREFKKIEKDCYFLRFDTEYEAIRKHSETLDLNGIDTSFTKYDRGNNPVVFSYYKLNEKSNKIVSTFIILHDDKFDVWFMEIDDKDTHFANVIDNTGSAVELIYLRP